MPKKSKKKKKLLVNKELALFFDQFAMTLDAGLNHTDGIQIMLEDAASSEGKEILETMLETLHEGKPLSAAFESAEVFPKYALDMMSIGERSGKTDDVAHSLANYYDREENIAQGIKNAVTYPMIIILMMFIVILVLIIKVLPVFNQVFIQLGSEMTGFSRGLLNLGNAISRYSLLFMGILILIIILYFILAKTDGGKAAFGRFVQVFPLTKGFYHKIAAGRFASSMALTMNTNLGPDESLRMVKNIVDNKEVETKIEEVRTMIRGGLSFTDALVDSGIFNNLYSRMISVGGKSGATDKALSKIATNYEAEIDDRISNIIAILEPTLVIIFSIVVCLILLSVMMPLMSIMSSIG
ncbi:MAG: type II secretion system F family protein [Lachnospiraceae bacterium]|nr:type II secretion system F family protein [Lachnospiraceae bacterium]